MADCTIKNTIVICYEERCSIGSAGSDGCSGAAVLMVTRGCGISDVTPQPLARIVRGLALTLQVFTGHVDDWSSFQECFSCP